MGRTFRVYLAGEVVYACRQCGNHLAVSESVISKSFNGQHGRAVLIHHAVNITLGEPEDRLMRTGNHTVRDIFCRVCNQNVGWKYDKAYEHIEKYKEGKFILERELIDEIPEKPHLSDRPHIEEIITSVVPVLNRM